MDYILEKVFGQACSDLGLCLSHADQVRLTRPYPKSDLDLANAILEAVGLDPDATDRHLRQSLLDLIERLLRYPCACCGHFVLSSPPGSYETCPVCNWEDDGLQLEFATTLAGGANHTTLEEAQRIHVRRQELYPAAPRPAPRDPEWRLIDGQRDRFPEWSAANPLRAPAHDTRLYYWRQEYWLNGS